MSSHNLLHGRNFVIKQNGELLALSKSCTVDVQANTIPVSGPTTGQWEDSIPGRKKWEVTCSHLMYNRGTTKPLDRMDMVGQIIELSLDILVDKSVKFDGFRSDIQIVGGSVTVQPNAFVYYDSVHRCFVVDDRGYYYRQWTYTDGSINKFDFELINDDTFYENIGTGQNSGEYYKAEDKDSSAQTYTLSRRDTTRHGMAIVKQWNGTFTHGHLAQGSFKFLGKGELSPL